MTQQTKVQTQELQQGPLLSNNRQTFNLPPVYLKQTAAFDPYCSQQRPMAMNQILLKKPQRHHHVLKTSVRIDRFQKRFKDARQIYFCPILQTRTYTPLFNLKWKMDDSR